MDIGSTDGSLQILKDYEKKDNRLKIFSQMFASSANAKNFAISEATGDYCYFANVNDCIAPSLMDYAQILFSTFDIDYFCFGSKAIKAESLVTLDSKKVQDEIRVSRDGFFNMNFDIAKDTNSGLFNKILKLSVIKENDIRFLENSKFEDVAFMWQYNFVARNAYFDDCIYHYHQIYLKNVDCSFETIAWYLYNWEFLFNQVCRIPRNFEKYCDNLNYLLEYYSSKAKSSVVPKDKYKIEKLKYSYKEKMNETMLQIDKEKQRVKMLEMQRLDEEEKVYSGHSACQNFYCNTKQDESFLSKILSFFRG